MTLQQILAQIKQQIKDINDKINAKQSEIDQLKADKALLVADRDALQAYLATLP